MACTVRRIEDGNVYVEVGGNQIEGVLLPNDQVPGEKYELNQRLNVYVKRVKNSGRSAQIVVSRTANGLVKRLFENEVPEIKQGIVLVKGVAREPGQFVNEPKAEFTGNELTHEAAAEYAFDRLMRKQYVSLGSWGGYIVVGFDHSIVNSDSDYDFSIQANAFNSGAGGSNEPGIVWVMQDVNGNGLPDDEWYELKGSETGKPETKQYYEVTYYKPSGPGQKVVWTDSDGKTDWVDFLGAYHWQDYYYPLWIKEDSYTLVGTHIASRNSQDPSTGFWTNANYEWGYADNWGSDVLAGDSYDGSGQQNGFKISNAIYPDGTPVNLKYIDFIKVQVGVLAKSGWLGEVSTEVFSFEDLTIKK